MENRNAEHKTQYHPINVPTAAEVGRMMDATGSFGVIGARDRALLTLLCSSGLRANEALALRREQVDLTSGKITVTSPKTWDTRVVGIDATVIAYVQEWLDIRRLMQVPDGAPLFCTRRGAPLAARFASSRIRTLGVRAGIKTRVNLHSLRRAFASTLASTQVDVREAARTLGHAIQSEMGLFDELPGMASAAETLWSRPQELTAATRETSGCQS